MTRGMRMTVVSSMIAAVVLAACSSKEKPPEYQILGEFVEAQDSFPRVRYFESDQVSVNDRCAVRRVKLNPEMPPVYVNGRPIGFC